MPILNKIAFKAGKEILGGELFEAIEVLTRALQEVEKQYTKDDSYEISKDALNHVWGNDESET